MPDEVAQGNSFDQLHDDVSWYVFAARLAEVVNPDDIGMTQQGGGACFAAKSLDRRGVSDVLLEQDFDPHLVADE